VGAVLKDLNQLKAVYIAAGLDTGGAEFKKDASLMLKRMRKALGGELKPPKKVKVEEEAAPAEQARKHPYTPDIIPLPARSPHTVLASVNMKAASLHEACSAVNNHLPLNAGAWARFKEQPSCHHRVHTLR
jgi:hypothetical protein